MSCKKWNNVCPLVTNCFCAHSSVVLCLFPSLLRNSGNKHKNNPLVSAETVRHLSTYIILYVYNSLVGLYSAASAWQFPCHFHKKLYLYAVARCKQSRNTVRGTFLLSAICNVQCSLRLEPIHFMDVSWPSGHHAWWWNGVFEIHGSKVRWLVSESWSIVGIYPAASTRTRKYSLTSLPYRISYIYINKFPWVYLSLAYIDEVDYVFRGKNVVQRFATFQVYVIMVIRFVVLFVAAYTEVHLNHASVITVGGLKPQ